MIRGSLKYQRALYFVCTVIWFLKSCDCVYNGTDQQLLTACSLTLGFAAMFKVTGIEEVLSEQ